MRRVISADWETPWGDDFSVKTLGNWKYARDPRCVPYLISVCDGETSWAGEPKDFNFASLEGATLVSHHRAFDEEVAIGGQERGLFQIPGLKTEGNDFWECSMDMSSYLWNVRSLAEAAQIGLGEKPSKDVRTRAKNKSAEDMKREGWWNDMLAYGRADAELCWRLWNKHSHKFPEFERRLSRMTMEQGRYGVRIDVPALEQAMITLQKVILHAQTNLPWVARGKKPGSPLGIAEECKIAGIPTPPVKAHDPDAAQEWEDTYAPHFKFVLALRNIRKAKKALATLETIKLRLRPDDTVSFALKYAGASTLRWAGDAGWNLQNMNKEPLFFDREFSFIFDKKVTRKLADEFDKLGGQSAVGELANGTKFFDMRGLVIARPGKKLAPVDLSQIEPRVLNYLAGNHELLALVREGMSIYEAHARKTMGWKNGDLKTANKLLYALAKARVLGLGYGCGWEKFIALASTYGIDITEGDAEFAVAASVDKKVHRRRKTEDGKWEYESVPEVEAPLKRPELKLATGESTHPWEDCVFVCQTRMRRGEEVPFVGALAVYGMRSRVTVEEFRKSNPLITELWDTLENALRNDEGRDFEIEGPHGGKLIYRNVRRERRKAVNKETGEEYERLVFTAEVGGKRVPLYGGLLCENTIQWVSRMAFAERMLDLDDQLRAEDPSQRVLWSVHDEAIPEINDPGSPEAEEKMKHRIEDIMSITPDWLAGCPLGAEAKIVNRYLK